jgi:peptide/nickel transport system permease protein
MIGQILFVLLGISILVFLIFFATPGADPAARIAGKGAAPEVLAAVRLSFGLNKPLYVQYLLMMKKIFITGDLTSFVNRGWYVIPAIMQAVPVTLSLVFGSAILWVGMSVGSAVLAVAYRNTAVDRILMAIGLVGLSMPVFWLGSVMNLLSQSRFHDTFLFSWVPPLGYTPLTQSPLGWLKGLLIPWFTLAFVYFGFYARVLRADIIAALQQDFVRTARAKGLSEKRILLRHALRTSLTNFVTIFGLDFGALVGGSALLAEVVFNLQGVGYLTNQALHSLDLPVIMATVLYSTFFVVLANGLVNILYLVIDPRVRAS